MTGKHARANRSTAFIATAMLLSMDAAAAAPEWVHLLPAGELRMNRQDNFKPLKPGQVPMLCSFDAKDPVDRAPIDVNHAYAKRGVLGEDTPAYGWLTELQSRDDGLWGKVEWNDRGRKAIADREYRGISAELMTINGEIIGVRGASLTNHPNLKGLTPLLQTADTTTEEDDFMDKILKDLLAKLGLKEDATPEAVLQSVTALVDDKTATTKHLAEIAKAAGAASDAKPEAILQSVTALATTGGDDKAIAGLRAELQTVTTELNTLKSNGAREKAVAFVDGAIAEGRVGVKPLRDHYIKRHMLSASDVETEINAMPKLSGSTIIPADMAKDGAVLLTADDEAVCKQLGITPEAFKKTKAASAAAKEA